MSSNPLVLKFAFHVFRYVSGSRRCAARLDRKCAGANAPAVFKVSPEAREGNDKDGTTSVSLMVVDKGYVRLAKLLASSVKMNG
jgi:hypothetical protein